MKDKAQQKTIMIDYLRDEFQRAMDKAHFQDFRDLCLKHNPRETFGRFASYPKNRKSPVERIMSVEQVVDEKAKNSAYWGMLQLFIRVLCASISTIIICGS